MRIGFDAKWFYAGHPSGKVFTTNIVEQLCRSHPEHEYVFFLNSKDSVKEFPFRGQNLKLRFNSIGNNLMSNAILIPSEARKEKLDILITQNFSAPTRKVKQVTIVFDVIFKTHPYYFTLLERTYFSLIRPLLRFSDAVVTISQSAKEDLQQFGFVRPYQSTHVLYLGVDDRYFQAVEYADDRIEMFKAKYQLPPRFILYVGRLNQRKNLENLLRAICRLRDQLIPVVLCGSKDWKMFDIDTLIDNLGLRHRVYQIGFLPDAELPLLYRSASIFAYVSKKEGFGLPPLEAMACGVPSVVSNVPSLVEVCGDCVEYVDPNQPEDIAKGIDNVLGSQTLQKRLVGMGLTRSKAFSWKTTTQKLLDIVLEVSQQRL